MNNDYVDITSHKNNLKRFQYLSAGRFTGVLTIQAPVASWVVLFHKGKMVWAIDRLCPHRFWQRQLLSHLPHLTLPYLAEVAAPLEIYQEIQPEISWPYLALVKLHGDGQITSQKLGSLLADSAQDILFDILQASYTTNLIYATDNCRLPQPPPIIMVFEKLMITPLRHWQEWRDSKLTNIYPDHIPVIDRPTTLYEQTTTDIYNKLAQIIDSTSSLREIALQQQQDLFLLARSLVPHLDQQTISFQPPRPDLLQPLVVKAPAPMATPTITAESAPAIPSGLVAYIDDNACANEYMADIVTSIGYHFLGIKDASEALELLQEQQPQLIIMEAAMPLANGRQVCQQIRRSDNLSKIPVVLIVDRENLAERILAKLAGADSIITHPIDHQKVSELIKRYVDRAPSIPQRS
jgi:CheY-like chemotaxis protein